jgi:membrane-associated phospholipid phosphatase
VERQWAACAGRGQPIGCAAVQEILGRLRDLDRRLAHALNAKGSSAGDAFFRSITELGSIWASAGAAAVLAARRYRREALDAFCAAGAMWLLGQGLKKVFDRPRPYEANTDVRLLIHRPRGSSWPSSHPAVLLAFVTVAGRDLDLSPRLRQALAGVVGAVGFSRVSLGVHYPGDVVGGILLGKGLGEAWAAFVSPNLLPRPSRAGPR